MALVFLSGHCSHSFDTLPVLAELHEEYASSDLTILPVYVNSGSVEDVHDWSSEMNLPYTLLVSKDKHLSEAYDSRMVPSFFLIDRAGKVTKKFVGYKSASDLKLAFAELLRS